MSQKSNEQENRVNQWWKWLWLTSVPLFVLLSGLQHFLYPWTGSTFIGLWAPVNESVWEHMKLIFFPMLCWWIVMFFVFRKKKDINPANWFTAMWAGQLIAILGVIMTFYTLYDGLAVPESLAIDIISEGVWLIIGQIVGYHVNKYAKLLKWMLWVSIAVTAAMIAVFIAFTFAPPEVPLFISSV